jgi:hypothetical protein
MKVGEKVFFLHTKKMDGIVDKTIKEGTLVGINIATTGYLMYDILVENEKVRVEEAHCFNTPGQAEDHYKAVNNLIDEGEAIINAATKKVADIRIKTIGEPSFEALAASITGGK